MGHRFIILFLAFFITNAFAAPGYICTARSTLGKAYHAKGIDKESAMLEALTECEKNHNRCRKAGCVITNDAYEIVLGHHTGWIKGDHFGRTYFLRAPIEGRLPESYEAIEDHKVKNQGQCGSCWAFGSVEAFIGAVLKRGGPALDLSQQQTVDCTPNMLKCNGGLFAGSYFVSKGLTDNEHYPYVAKSQSCKLGSNPIMAKALSAGLIGKSSRRPTTDQIRQAMVDYGVLGVTLNATNSFANHKKGVFRQCSGGQANHLVAITKYYPDPDKPGKYVFRVKNSWGDKIQDGGYIDMPEGCNSLGYDETGFVVFKDSPVAPPSAKLPAEIVAHMGDEIILAVKEESGVDYKWTNKAGTVLSQKATATVVAMESDEITLSARNSAGELMITMKLTVVK